MQYSLSLLALASSAVATFRNAPPFPCPANQDNKCTDMQKPGFSFDDLPNGGPFFQYKDFVWNGWTAQPAAPGGRFGKRTFGKGIGGICGPNKNQSPSFGCGPKVDKFSLGSIHVKPEFDCDLEFHYDMPDGKKCKHRNFCRKTGTTVVNTQCGGAKNVTIVYPPQPNKPKPSCSIVVPTVSFDCSTASSTVPPKTTTTSTTSTTSASSVPATTTSTTLSTASSKPASSVPSQGTTSGDIVSTSTSPAPASSTAPGISTSETTSVKPVPSSSFIFPNSSTTALSSSTPGSTPGTPGTPASTASSTSGSTPGTTAGTPPATTSTTTYVTTFDTTSTLFTTVTSTITSCEPTVPDCPAGGVKTTVVTVATSTTICPVTSTLTSVVSQPPVQTPPVNPPKDTSSTGPVGGVSTTSAGTGTVVKPPSTTSAIPPIETLPCPNVVPSCLNTFLFSVGCSHNSDAACFCPDTIFVKNIFDCIYAHGESDQVISEAVIFFQGICAPYIGSNPGIATDATITTYITATATPTVSIVTTVTLDVTTVVPCTDSLGSTIPSSSTTSVLSTILTIPQVGFTTGTNNDVAIIPVTTALPVETQPGGGFVPTGDNGFFTPTPAPTGTGGLVPSALPSIVTAGAGRTGAGVGFAVAAAGLIAAML